jgi:hypothetical protein
MLDYFPHGQRPRKSPPHDQSARLPKPVRIHPPSLSARTLGARRGILIVENGKIGTAGFESIKRRNAIAVGRNAVILRLECDRHRSENVVVVVSESDAWHDQRVSDRMTVKTRSRKMGRNMPHFPLNGLARAWRQEIGRKQAVGRARSEDVRNSIVSVNVSDIDHIADLRSIGKY